MWGKKRYCVLVSAVLDVIRSFVPGVMGFSRIMGVGHAVMGLVHSQNFPLNSDPVWDME